ncbi:MAG: DNA alkylation repair protein [Nocardioides sp.]|nr:DNA alkylation repair protein [Nocardioides sp.]
MGAVDAGDGDALIAALRARLEAVGDAERARQMQAYMKSEQPFHGVPAPVRRRLERECFAAHPLEEPAWRTTTKRLWDEATHREERYAAISLARWRTHRAAATHPDMLPLYRHLVTSGAWWDLVDETAQHLVWPVLAAHRTEVTPVMREWATDDDLWVRRTAILCQEPAKAETDLALLDAVLALNLEDSLHGRTFWIRKAIGWALRSYSRTDPAWVRTWSRPMTSPV